MAFGKRVGVEGGGRYVVDFSRAVLVVEGDFVRGRDHRVALLREDLHHEAVLMGGRSTAGTQTRKSRKARRRRRCRLGMLLA